MTELTKTDFRLATMLTRVAVLASAMVVLLACHDIYYQPSFENFPDEEDALPYDREIIPADGDTCWFNYHLEKIMVKAVDIEHPTKDLKWEVLIDGNQYGDTKHNNRDGLVFDRDKWWQERTGLQYSIYQTFFEVPANPSINTRNIEVRASINHSLVPDLDEWGEWFTVFDCKQAGKVFSEDMMPSHSLEKSEANIFEPVRIDMHKCDEANSLWWYKSKGVCDSLVWSIRGFEDTKIIMEDGYESIYFGHLFTHPGELESVLSAYKDGKVIYEDVKNITITNKKDFLMFDWEEIVSGTAEGGSYHNAFDDNRWFSSGVSCEDGNPVIIFNWNDWEDNSEEENRRILREYISHIYGEPVYTEKSEVEAQWAGLFVRRDDRYRPECIWMTETSAVALFYVYNELTETGDWKIIAEPLRK